MNMKTDIQIARECELKPIGEIASQMGIAPVRQKASPSASATSSSTVAQR